MMGNLVSAPRLTQLADKVFILVARGSRTSAADLLTANGYTDVEKQLDTIAGFIKYMQQPVTLRW